MTANPRTNNWVPLAPDFPENKCEGKTELFFPATAKESIANSKEIKELCFSCIHRTDCLEYAVVEGLGGGWFGGTSPTEIKRLSRARGVKEIALPPKRELGKAEYQLRLEGKSWQFIANRYATSTATIERRVQRYLDRSGLKEKVVA